MELMSVTLQGGCLYQFLFQSIGDKNEPKGKSLIHYQICKLISLINMPNMSGWSLFPNIYTAEFLALNHTYHDLTQYGQAWRGTIGEHQHFKRIKFRMFGHYSASSKCRLYDTNMLYLKPSYCLKVQNVL